MKCPHCDVMLVMTDKQGVEIDYCPQCRGVWLDRGELDKIIERSAGYDQEKAVRNSGSPELRHGHHEKDNHHGKRKSFLMELFD